jgi:hypothetical protein
MAALADPISVNNPSFEKPPAGGFTACAGTGCSYIVGSNPARTANGAVTFGEFQPGTLDGTTVQTGVMYTLQVSLGWRNDMPSFVGTADLLVNGNQYFVTDATPAQGTGPFLRQRTLVCLAMRAIRSHPIERRSG